MKLTLPKAKLHLKHVFTDVDGSHYYTNEKNDIVNKRGELVTMIEESNVRDILRLIGK